MAVKASTCKYVGHRKFSTMKFGQLMVDSRCHNSLLPKTIFWLQLSIKLIAIHVKRRSLLSTKRQALSNSPILTHFIFSMFDTPQTL